MIEEEKINTFDSRLNYKKNNMILGFIEYRNMYDNIDVLNFFVEEKNRNNGIGNKLLKELIKKYSNNIITLEVKEDNKVAIHLYEKYLFKKISERKKYYKDKTALIMRREKKIYILAIESSCDETSASIIKNGTEDVCTIINTQIDTHKKYGGVVPEIASRMHLENITIVIDQLLKKSNMKLADMDAFACTYAPGLLGSLLVGLEVTKTLSLIYNKPFIKINHMMGHIYANKINKTLDYPLISLIISGGHTDLILMKSEEDFKYIGSTLDDAIGECFDKVARILGLSYPGGPNIEKLALNGKSNYKMPNILKDESFNFSFSGIKSHINNFVHNESQRGNEINKSDLACSFQETVTNHLVDKTYRALKKYNINNLIVSGGVASNSYIKEHLEKMCKENNISFNVPNKKYCTDNAAMIGAAAYIKYKNNEFSSLDTNANPNENL